MLPPRLARPLYQGLREPSPIAAAASRVVGAPWPASFPGSTEALATFIAAHRLGELKCATISIAQLETDAVDDQTSEPYGVRAPSGISLSGIHPAG